MTGPDAIAPDENGSAALTPRKSQKLATATTRYTSTVSMASSTRRAIDCAVLFCFLGLDGWSVRL
jgi:hypothetical protein